MHDPNTYLCTTTYRLTLFCSVAVASCPTHRVRLADLKPCEFSLALMRCDRAAKLRKYCLCKQRALAMSNVIECYCVI